MLSGNMAYCVKLSASRLAFGEVMGNSRMVSFGVMVTNGLVFLSYPVDPMNLGIKLH